MRIPVSAQSTYAPIRYEATRPFAVALGKIFVAHAKRGEKERVRFVGDELMDLVAHAVNQVGPPRGPGPGQAEMLNVQIFGQYQAAGKVIFDVSKALTRALLITDARDIPCGEVDLPAPSCYFHFGGGLGADIDGQEVEGAFVTRAGDRLMIDLVPRGFGSPFFTMVPSGEALIGVPIDMSDPQKLITNALHDSIENVMRRNSEVMERAAAMERQIEAEYGQIVKVPSPVHDLAKNEPLLRKVLSLVINAVFYLEAEPEDCVDGWDSDAPQDVVKKLQLAAKPGAIRTLENTLLKAGYTKVRIVGRRFAGSVEAAAIERATESGRQLSPHFRRGHFRAQVHGPQRSLRKRIFVAPVLVNAGLGEPLGRVYAVE